MTTYNLLLVDDEPNILSSLQRLLRTQKYCVFTATSGKEGLNILQREKISLIISDQQMFEMDGIEFLKRARAKWPDTIRIMLTGHANVTLVMEAVNNGNIYGFITKPWDEIELITIIKQGLKQYELIQQNKRLQKSITLQNIELKKTNDSLEKKVKERTGIISAQKDELEKFNKELEIKVSNKTDQLRQKDIQLLEMDRTAGIATLAAGIAHEINNPLSFIKSSTGSIKKSVDKFFEAIKYWDNKPIPENLLNDYKNYLEQINYTYCVNSLDEKFNRTKKGIERIMKIVNSLKNFSMINKEDIGKLDINNSIEEALEILSVKDTKKIEFVKEFQRLPPVECYKKKINQCLLHTIKDGIDAIEGTGKIIIITSCANEDDKVTIQIRDNGRGMSPDVLRQVFNPFFTTKAVGSGIGVGLSITERIIKNHGGHIQLSSKEGKGTTVTISLPITEKMNDRSLGLGKK